MFQSFRRAAMPMLPLLGACIFTPAFANVVTDAGPDQVTYAGTTVTLNGQDTASDAGAITRWRWKQVSGESVALSSPNSQQTEFTAPAVTESQELIFRLLAVDADNDRDGDRIKITVLPPDVENTQLTTLALKLAQTHVLPVAGLEWRLLNDNDAEVSHETLHFTGNREALVLARIQQENASGLLVEGQLNGETLGSIALSPPSDLPPSVGGEASLGKNWHSSRLPAHWMRPGLRIRVTANNFRPSGWRKVKVGADVKMTLRVLPFYLFGADEQNSGHPLQDVGAPPADAVDEMFAKWPVTELDADNHPLGKVEWPTLIVPPRTDRNGQRQPAYIASSLDDYRDGFAGLSTLHGLVRHMLYANGEDRQPVQYYAPLIGLDADGNYQGAGGGIGGSSVGTGTPEYTGIFIHEQGHAFGLPHAGDAFDNDRFPYEWGSLDGSSWGYDQRRGVFLPPWVPASAYYFDGCDTHEYGGHARASDKRDRCVRQDPMQGGSGDQAEGMRFSLFADYSTGVMQRYFEGRTTNTNGQNSYSGGKVFADSAFASGWKRWDSIDQTWVEFQPTTLQGGLYGLDQGLPIEQDVPVVTIIATASGANTVGITQIYPPLYHRGNLIRTIDAEDANDLASIVPNTSENYWYCKGYGCDYSLRVHYDDGSQRTIVLQSAFRPWFNPTGESPAEYSDPLNSGSFITWGVNVPDDGDISRIELLETPEVWNGLPEQPVISATWEATP